MFFVCVQEKPAHDQQQSEVPQTEPASAPQQDRGLGPRLDRTWPALGELVRGLQHLHQESVNRRVPDEFEEEQMLQALQADGA